MTVLEVFIFRGDQLIGSRVFSESAVTIGRGNAAHLRLDDKQISRIHATIVVDGARMFVRDEGSQIGTKVNGQRVREQTLREVDTVEIGTFRLKFTRRAMGGASDFEEEEPTDAGQLGSPAHRNKRRRADESLGGMVISLDAGKQTAPAPKEPTPETPAFRQQVIPVLVVTPTHPARDDEQTKQVNPHNSKRDSSFEELSAGSEESKVRTFEATPLPAPMPPKAELSEVAPLPTASPQQVAPLPKAEEPVQVAATSKPINVEDVEIDVVSEFERDLATQRKNIPALAPSQETPLVPQEAVAVERQADPNEAEAEAVDEDDEEEEIFVPSFSLLQVLEGEPSPNVPTAPYLQIVHHNGGRVIDIQHLGRNENFPSVGRRLLRLDPEGKAQLAITEEVNGTVYLNRRPIPLEEIRRGAQDRKGVALLEMREGDTAHLTVTHQSSQPTTSPNVTAHYQVRFVRLPEARKETAARFSGLSLVKNFFLLGSLSVHALILIALGLLPAQESEGGQKETRFAEVSLKQIQLEPPPPEVKPPDPEPEPPSEKPVLPQVQPKVTKVVKVRTPRAATPKSAASALAALENIRPTDTTPSALKDVVTNINAVSVAPDVRSRFKVGGAIGKLPDGQVRLSTAGVARDTSSGRELLSKENVGTLKGAGGSGNVRGVVKQAPQAQLQAAGSGRLSKGQIQKVINDHVAQVQACYEKALVRDHSLGGKVTFDWEISPTGNVTGARVRSSTMAGSAVSACILAEIRTWVFPQPEGGSVSVTYPFIFSAQGF